MNNTHKPRDFWSRFRLFLALAAGAWLAILGLSGSLTVFFAELEEILHPELVVQKAAAGPRSWDDILGAVKKEHPHRDKPWNILAPRNDTSTVTFYYNSPEEYPDDPYQLLVVSVDPYKAKIVRSYLWDDTFPTWIYSLHYSMLLQERGAQLLGALSIVLVLLLPVGFYVWWPRKRASANVLVIPGKAPVSPAALRVRRAVVIFSAALLLVIFGSAAVMSFPDQAARVTKVFSTVPDSPELTSVGGANQTRISVSRAIEIARGAFPQGSLKTITTPDGPGGVWEVTQKQPEEIFRNSRPDSTVWIDQYSGKLLRIRDPGGMSAGEKFLTAQWSFHSGDAFGMPLKLLYFAVGFVPLLLFIAGVRRWLATKRG